MTRLLLDQGIPLSAAARLQSLGFDAVHIQTLGMGRATDRNILEYARSERRTVVTLDADFHALLAMGNEAAPSVMRIRREGLSGQAIAQLLLQIWPMIQAQIEAGAMASITEKAVRIGASVRAHAHRLILAACTRGFATWRL
jgi:predicted nuclease of predicted toxin-antitoxin system